MAARAGSTRWASQAAQDALLKFSPQRTSLAEALRAAQETYGQTVQAGNTSAKLTQSAARAAYPAIGQIYSKADAGTQAGQTLVNSDLAALPGVANQYKADQAGEVQQQLANLLSARSSDQAMLTNQGVNAAAGAQFNQTNARQALQKTVAGLISKSQTTSQEQGAFAATEAERLAQEAEKLEQAETASIRSANTSTANSQRSQSGAERRSERGAATTRRGQDLTRTSAAEAHRGAAGVKPLTTDQQNKALSTVSSIQQFAGPLLRGGHTRAEVIERLQQGTPSVSGKTKAGNDFKTPAIPAYKPDVLMSAAIDLAERGGVRQHTWDRLTSAGYSPTYLSSQGIKVKEPQQAGLHSRAHMG